MEKIGICDWGIGGIGMMQHLCELAHYDIVYLSDAGYIPYGKVPERELKSRWEQVKSFFQEKGVTKIAIACNALSTIVDEEPNYITVIKSGVAQVLATSFKTIGVTGGFRTVESQAYYDSFQVQGYEVKQSIGQVLSAKVEAGDLTSQETILAIKSVFEPLRSCEAVLLACTHYPVLSEQINKYFPNIVLLDPALKMAQMVDKQWSNKTDKTNIEWNTTGDVVTMKSSARISFNEKIENPIKVIL